jgi:hypothetical protein
MVTQDRLLRVTHANIDRRMMLAGATTAGSRRSATDVQPHCTDRNIASPAGRFDAPTDESGSSPLRHGNASNRRTRRLTAHGPPSAPSFYPHQYPRPPRGNESMPGHGTIFRRGTPIPQRLPTGDAPSSGSCQACHAERFA